VVLPDGTTHAGRTPAHWRRVALIVARIRLRSFLSGAQPDNPTTLPIGWPGSTSAREQRRPRRISSTGALVAPLPVARHHCPARACRRSGALLFGLTANALVDRPAP
jgi:hypothetical protein